jgi:hypothetical protein
VSECWRLARASRAEQRGGARVARAALQQLNEAVHRAAEERKLRFWHAGGAVAGAFSVGIAHSAQLLFGGKGCCHVILLSPIPMQRTRRSVKYFYLLRPSMSCSERCGQGLQVLAGHSACWPVSQDYVNDIAPLQSEAALRSVITVTKDDPRCARRTVPLAQVHALADCIPTLQGHTRRSTWRPKSPFAQGRSLTLRAVRCQQFVESFALQG